MLAYDELLLREPNLLIPGRKPVGPVRLRHDNDMADSIYAYSLCRRGGPHGPLDLEVLGPIPDPTASLVTRLESNGDASLAADYAYIHNTGGGSSGDNNFIGIDYTGSGFEQVNAGNLYYNAFTVIVRAPSPQVGYSDYCFVLGGRLIHLRQGNPTKVYSEVSTGTISVDTGINLWDGSFHTISLFREQRTHQIFRVAVDGMMVAEVNTGTYYNLDYGMLAGGAYYESTGGYGADIELKLVILHKWGVYSLEQLLRFSADPYQFLEPA